jgi:RHS repeat-associated protein
LRSQRLQQLSRSHSRTLTQLNKSFVPTFAFAGEDYDDVVSLIFLRARYYSPGLKRFISEDDFSGISTVPISLNRYIYCHNSPVSYVDPTGHIVWIPIVLLLIGGGISAVTYHYFTPPEKRT